jgi:hypothetical protein
VVVGSAPAERCTRPASARMPRRSAPANQRENTGVVCLRGKHEHNQTTRGAGNRHMRAAGRCGVRWRDRDQDSSSDIRRSSAVQPGRGQCPCRGRQDQDSSSDIRRSSAVQPGRGQCPCRGRQDHVRHPVPLHRAEVGRPGGVLRGWPAGQQLRPGAADLREQGAVHHVDGRACGHRGRGGRLRHVQAARVDQAAAGRGHPQAGDLRHLLRCGHQLPAGEEGGGIGEGVVVAE